MKRNSCLAVAIRSFVVAGLLLFTLPAAAGSFPSVLVKDIKFSNVHWLAGGFKVKCWVGPDEMANYGSMFGGKVGNAAAYGESKGFEDYFDKNPDVRKSGTVSEVKVDTATSNPFESTKPITKWLCRMELVKTANLTSPDQMTENEKKKFGEAMGKLGQTKEQEEAEKKKKEEEEACKNNPLCNPLGSIGKSTGGGWNPLGGGSGKTGDEEPIDFSKDGGGSVMEISGKFE